MSLFLALIAAFAVKAASCVSPPAGLVGWWPADGSVDDIAGTNNGVLMGGATANAPGVVGTAFQFDGTNAYVQIPDAPVFHPTNLTVEAWVLFTSLDTPAVGGSYPGQQYIIFKQNSQSSEFEGFALSKDRYPAYVGTNDTFVWEVASSSGQLVFLESQTKIVTNVWYYVAGVRGSNYLQLYVNGQLEGQTNVNFPQDYGTQPLYFGSSGESYYDHKFAGKLDEVSLYNRALTSNEIAAIYAAGSAGKCRGPLPTSVSLTASPNPAPPGSPVTFTSTVGVPYGTPTGTVTFMEGATVLGTALLNGSGAATFTTNDFSSAGSPYSITAVYGGDGNYLGSTGSVSLAILPACVSAPAGLTGWWPADGSAVDIVAGHNGVLMGGATANAPGVVGTAFQFDGTNDYVQIPDSPAFHPTNLTVEAWVLFTSLDTPAIGSSYAGQELIVFKQNTRSANFEGFNLYKNRYPPNSGAPDTFFWQVSSASGATAYVSSHTTITTNVWYYVAGVRGSNYLQLYVNGKLEGQTSVNFPQNYGNLPLYFGSSGESYWDHRLAGRLDEVSLYNRALTSNEIAALYAAGRSGKCRGVLPTANSLTVSPNPAPFGSSVTFTSTVTNTNGIPTGTVTFMDGTAVLGSGILNSSGVATFSTNQFPITGGPHLISAVYGGDINFAGSTSDPVALSVGTTCVSPPAGLTDWWPAEGNADDIIGGHNGVLAGGATANAPGVVGSAFQFDGTSAYVEIPDSPAFHPTNLTVEAWVLFTSLDTPPLGGSYPGQQYIVFKQNSRFSDFEGFELSKDRYPPNVGTNDTFCWEVTSSAGQLVFLESKTTIVTNQWYYVAGVRGSNYLQLYINGQLEGQTNVNFPQDYGNEPLYFGSSGQSYYDHKFAGKLDEVSLYDRALTSNEIAAIYAAGTVGKCRGALPTTISLVLSTNLATYGSVVAFTCTVTNADGVPTGTVMFMDGATVLGTGLLNGSGVATFSTNKLSVAGSPHSITAAYGGDSNFDGSTSSPVSLTINPAGLTVTADNKTRWFGTTNPPLTAQISGFAAGDTSNVVSGSPGLSTIATPSSPPASYPITASLGTLSATNYTFGFVNGTLAVLALPELSAVGANESQFNFSFPTVSNQSYQVEYRTNLLLGTWLPLGSPIMGDGSPLTITNNMNDPQGFFRLNLQP